jgi:hypothetical protein
MRCMARALLLVVLASCATGRWESVRAKEPATAAELAAYPLTLQEPDAELASALAAVHFKVVQRRPYRQELQLQVEREGGELRGTLRSDGYFVDEVVAPDERALAERLASSQRVAEFVRNSGTPQQRMHPN